MKLNVPQSRCLVVLALAIILRLIWISAPLSSDELANASIWAQMPFAKIISNYQYPNNHIFLTLVLSQLLKVFGVDEIALRLPVLVCGVMSVCIAYLTTLRITGRDSLALICSLLLAISSQHIYYSTNARGYMIIMLFSQIVVHRAIVWLQCSVQSISFKDSFILGLICFFGTWTLPTFVMFEVSLMVFLLSVLIKMKSTKADVLPQLINPILVMMLCLAGFYVQYYVLISSDMLKMGMANAMSESNTLSQLIPSIFNEWIHPFEQISIVIIIFVAVGVYRLYKTNFAVAALLISILIIPPLLTLILLSGKIINNVPHARVFLFQLPFCFMLLIIGAERFLAWMMVKFTQVRFEGVICGIMILPFVYYSAIDLCGHVYPERLSREPYDKVLRFIKGLGPTDLIVASNKIHVGFYLYGAMEMRARVENIVDKQDIGDIYFIVYTQGAVSDMSTVNVSGVECFKFTDHIPIATQDSNQADLLIPAIMFDRAAHYDHFDIYKIKHEYIHTQNKIKSLNDMQGWSGVLNARIEPYVTPIGMQPAIRFDDMIYWVSQRKIAEAVGSFSLNINILSSSMPDNAGAFYLNAHGESLQIANSWIVNAWVMDHPYGSSIMNRAWHPAVFLSDSRDSQETIRTQFKGQGGAIRGVQSYRLGLDANSN